MPAPTSSTSRSRCPTRSGERCLELDLEAVWRVSKAVLPAMLAKGAGAIVNIASVPRLSDHPACFPYPVAKHALLGLTRSLGIEYAAQGIRVNAIAPGYIETPIATPTGRPSPIRRPSGSGPTTCIRPSASAGRRRSR